MQFPDLFRAYKQQVAPDCKLVLLRPDHVENFPISRSSM